MNVEEALYHLKELTGEEFTYGRFFNLSIFGLETELGQLNLLYDPWRKFYMDQFALSINKNIEDDGEWSEIVTKIKKMSDTFQLMKRGFSDKHLYYKDVCTNIQILKQLSINTHISRISPWHYGSYDLSHIDIYGVIQRLTYFKSFWSIYFGDRLNDTVRLSFPDSYFKRDIYVTEKSLSFKNLQKCNPFELAEAHANS